jgi:autotransporter-associated beta strand protein
MVGTGTWTLSGTNTYTGGTTISSGTLRLGDGVSRNGVVAGNITDNATLEFATPADQTYSGVISGTGTLVKSGAGMLTLDNTETYSGGTVISNGTLLVSGSLAGGTVTVQTNGILGGAGIIGGNVAVYGTLAPGIVTPGTTMNITSNLDLSVGGSLSLNVSDIYYFGSDQVNVGTLMAGGTLKLTALSGSADLDTNADYILLTAATSIVGTFNISPAWQGTPPANAANFIIQNSGNNVVLHYASVLPPTVTASANPDTTGRYQTITVTAVVAPGDGAITSVTVDASSIGGSSTASLVLSNANVYTNSFTVSPATTLGLTTLLVTVTDANALTVTYPVGLTVVPTLETWNGAGSDDNWSTAANWTNGYAPLTGDLVFFDGSTRTSPILETGYTVAGVTFDSGAAAFTLGGSGSTLTLAGGVTNNSAYPQTVSVPIQLPNANRATFNTASNDMILANDIYDGGYGLFTTGGHALILTSPTLSYNGNMTIDNASALEVGGSGQLDAGNYVGQITNRGTFLYSSSADQTLSGVMRGAGGITKTNNSTLYLVANNTYSGTNQINAGTINVGNGGTTGSLGTGPIENNGTLTVNLGAPTIFNFPAGGTTGSGTISATAETILFNGSVTSGGSQNYTSTSTGITPSNRGLRFPVNGTALVATNGSSITLSGDSGCNTNSRRGTLTIDTSSGNGTVNLDISIGWQKFLYPYNQLTVDAGTGAINVSGPHSTNGWNNIPVSLSGAVDITADILSLGNNLTINATAPSSMSGILSGPAKLVKDGPADLVITNIQAYTGTTTVSNGTLLVNGSLDSGSAVTVEGGTLGGNGSIGGSVTVNGGELSPGASIGALTINSNLILNAGSTSTFEVNADTPTNDIIVLGDTVTYGGTLNIVATGTFSLGQTFTLFSGAGATNASNFASITGSPGTGLAFSFANGLLSVVNATVAPVTLTNSISGNTLTLTWPAGQGWVLQSQTNNLSTGLQVNPGTWGTVPGDGSVSITINPANPTVFYRLVH